MCIYPICERKITHFYGENEAFVNEKYGSYKKKSYFCNIKRNDRRFLKHRLTSK